MKFKSFLVKFDKYFLYLNILFAVLLLLSYLSAVISPGVFWPLAFLGLGYSILLFINLIFIVYWVIRRRKYVLISTIGILVGYNVLLNSVGFNFFQAAVPANHLKLMTYNVHVFKNMEEIPAYRQILKVVNSSQPDIIAFQEYYTQYSRFAIRDSLTHLFHSDQFHFVPFKISPYDSTGLALYSKYPIVNKGIVRLSDEQNDNQGIFIDVNYHSRIIRVYCLHLKSLQLDPVESYNLDKAASGKVIGFSRLRGILRKLKDAFIVREHQVEIIRRQTAKCPYPYIFMGDFNDTPGSYAFNKISAGMKNAFREKGVGIGKTYNGGFASFQIDFILASPQFSILNYGIVHKSISDHYPVYSDVALH